MAKVKESKDVVKRSPTSMQTVDFMNEVKELGVDGFEGVDSSVFTMPFLKIAQPTTSEAVEGEGHIAGLKPGLMFNSVSGSVYGEKARFVILGFKHVFLRFGSEQGDFHGYFSQEELDEQVRKGVYEKNGLKYETVNKIQRKKETVPEESAIDAHTLYVMCIDKPEDGVMIFTFKSTGLKHSRKWITKARAATFTDPETGSKVSAPLPVVIWEATTMKNTNDDGTWYLLGDKKVCLINQVGNIMEKQYQKLQPQVLEGFKFVQKMIEDDLRVDLRGGVEKDAPANDDDFE